MLGNQSTDNSSGGASGLGGTVARSGNSLDFNELSASGNQAHMLALTGTSNVGIADLYRLKWDADKLRHQHRFLGFQH